MEVVFCICVLSLEKCLVSGKKLFSKFSIWKTEFQFLAQKRVGNTGWSKLAFIQKILYRSKLLFLFSWINACSLWTYFLHHKTSADILTILWLMSFKNCPFKRQVNCSASNMYWLKFMWLYLFYIFKYFWHYLQKWLHERHKCVMKVRSSKLNFQKSKKCLIRRTAFMMHFSSFSVHKVLSVQVIALYFLLSSLPISENSCE